MKCRFTIEVEAIVPHSQSSNYHDCDDVEAHLMGLLAELRAESDGEVDFSFQLIESSEVA